MGTYAILWVCHSQEAAVARREQFGQGEDLFFTYVGGALVGRGFDEIIIDNFLPFHDERDLKLTQWLTEYLPTKLFPGGIIHQLSRWSHLD